MTAAFFGLRIPGAAACALAVAALFVAAPASAATKIERVVSPGGIEAWLVRLPQTTLYVPYWIGLPTPLGRGGATLTKIKIELD